MLFLGSRISTLIVHEPPETLLGGGVPQAADQGVQVTV